MKKNININLFGTLYNIDEDAYNLLEQYLTNMKSYFGRQEGGDEIVDDIEHRIAELFWELKQSGVEAIDIAMVKTIIEKIGNPEQMDDAQPETEFQEAEEEQETAGERFAKQSKEFAKNSSENLKEWMSHRKYFRDDHDKVIAGVLSGLSQYCGGGDPLAWRIAFVVLVLCFHGMMFLPVMAYLIAWLIAPVAKTAEDRLWMRGEAVSPENIRDEVLNGQERTKQKPESQQSKGSNFRSFLVGMVNMIAGLTKFVLIFVAGCFLVSVIGGAIALISVIFAVTTGFAGALTFMPLSFVHFITGTHTWLLALVACFVVLSVISVYALIRWVRNTDKPMSTSSSIILLIIWLIALFAIIPISLGLAANVSDMEDRGLLEDEDEWEEIDKDETPLIETLPADTLVITPDTVQFPADSI